MYSWFVSILVLMDFPVWLRLKVQQPIPILCFNPCSYGFPCMTGPLTVGRHCASCVSILVLMDFPVWLLAPGTWTGREICFNPCSYGFPCMTVLKSFNRSIFIKFQSLFLWISLYDTRGLRSMTVTRAVSILVLMDFPVWLEVPNRDCLCPSSFNPCSYGFPCMTWSQHTPISNIISFNPCSYGFPCMTLLYG